MVMKKAGTRYGEEIYRFATRRRTAWMRGTIHRGKVSSLKSCFNVVRLYSRFPSSLAETSIPVTKRKKPTPPIQPIKMWRGKKLTREPSLKAPRTKNTIPVKTELIAKAVIVVAKTTSGLSVPILAMIL